MLVILARLETACPWYCYARAANGVRPLVAVTSRKLLFLLRTVALPALRWQELLRSLGSLRQLEWLAMDSRHHHGGATHSTKTNTNTDTHSSSQGDAISSSSGGGGAAATAEPVQRAPGDMEPPGHGHQAAKGTDADAEDTGTISYQWRRNHGSVRSMFRPAWLAVTCGLAVAVGSCSLAVGKLIGAEVPVAAVCCSNPSLDCSWRHNYPWSAAV